MTPSKEQIQEVISALGQNRPDKFVQWENGSWRTYYAGFDLTTFATEVVAALCKAGSAAATPTGGLVAEWQAEARKHTAAALEDDAEVGGDEWFLHRESARIYERCAKQLNAQLVSPPEPAATPPQERAYQAARDNLREAWAALAMIRETVEMLAPSGSVKASEHLDGPTFMHEADALVSGIMALASGFGGETIQTLLDLLNPLHGELDRQTYDAKVAVDFDNMPSDYAHDVMVTAQQERDLTQAVLILEDRKLALSPHLRPMQSGGE